MRDAALVGPAVSPASRRVLHWGVELGKACGARMETRREQLAMVSEELFFSGHVSVDMFEEYWNEPSRIRGCAGTMACGFGLLRGAKPPCARTAPRSARWRGAPADQPPGELGGVARAPPAVFSLGACWLTRLGCRVGSRALGEPFARCGSVLLDFSRSVIRQGHKSAVVIFDRRVYPLLSIF